MFHMQISELLDLCKLLNSFKQHVTLSYVLVRRPINNLLLPHIFSRTLVNVILELTYLYTLKNLNLDINLKVYGDINFDFGQKD